MIDHQRCGCPEQHKGLDCPACRGTGLIPPVARTEWDALRAQVAELEVENIRLQQEIHDQESAYADLVLKNL